MYDKKKNCVLQQGSHAPVDLTAVAVQTFSHVLFANMRVTRLMARVTTAIVSTGAVELAYRRRPSYNSATGQSTLGTLSIPAGAAAGDVYYSDIDPVDCNLGDQVVVSVTAAAAGGGAAGQALCDFEADLDSEFASNQSNMIESA